MMLEAWKPHWGKEYRRDLKEMHLRTILMDLHFAGKLGPAILDVGSGAHPVSEYFFTNYRVITIDIEGKEGEWGGRLHIKKNVESLIDTQTLSTKKALVKMARYLNIDPHSSKAPIDTMIFSELLNYVDFRAVLDGAGTFLKPGGILIVANKPNFGFSELFSAFGVKKNQELVNYMSHNDYVLLKQEFPWDINGKIPDNESMMILVAQKLDPNLNSIRSEPPTSKKQFINRLKHFLSIIKL